jgi:hypothetical protein
MRGIRRIFDALKRPYQSFRIVETTHGHGRFNVLGDRLLPSCQPVGTTRDWDGVEHELYDFRPLYLGLCFSLREVAPISGVTAKEVA